jgi:hypothetical protein
MREEHRPRVFENLVLRSIFEPKRDEVTGGGEKHITRSLMICTAHQTLFGGTKHEKSHGQDALHVRGQTTCRQGFGLET